MLKRNGVIVLFALMLTLFASAAMAATQEVEVFVTNQTDRPVPVELRLDVLSKEFGMNFAANWDSVRVYNPAGEEIPYQIDDMDLSNSISGDDVVAFTGSNTGTYKISVSDDPFAEKPLYKNQDIKISENKDGYTIELTNGTVFKLDAKGILNLKGYEDYVKDVASELGLVRIAGFPKSTWWADKNLGPHAEMVSKAFRVKDVRILEEYPVRLTIVSKLASNTFPGVEQTLISSIYPSGEVKINNTFNFRAYSDLSKLQSQATHILEKEEDTRHILPVFRRMGWADAKEYTPKDYWQERDALITVEDNDYISFPASDTMKPLFWGANYIFASIERWRANYSNDAKVGFGEVVLNVPEVPEDEQEFLTGPSWVLEAGEFRTGQFQWIAGEFKAFPGTEDVETSIDKTVLHYIPGDIVNYQFYYIPFKANGEEEAIKFLDARSRDLAKVIK